MKRVYSAQHPTEAYMVKGLLEAVGIESQVRGEVLFAARGELPLTPETAPSVWVVDDRRYDEALSVVHRYEQANRGELAAGESWCCLECGEEMEGQFTHCWQCGTARGFPPLSEKRQKGSR